MTAWSSACTSSLSLKVAKKPRFLLDLHTGADGAPWSGDPAVAIAESEVAGRIEREACLALARLHDGAFGAARLQALPGPSRCAMRHGSGAHAVGERFWGILVSSAAARFRVANHEAIAAAKAGKIGLMLSAAATNARHGIRVSAVAPGLI